MIAVYLRVSTSQQKLANQVPDVHRWLEGHGHELKEVLWFEDQETGENLQRPEFEKLQAAIFNGEVDTVVIWRLDRLSRNLVDGVNTVATWCDKGVRLVSVTQQLDLSGVTGKMIAAILFGIAESELDNLRERTSRGQARAKREGAYKGRKPGTVNRSKKGKEYDFDPVAKTVDLWNKGNTIADICRAADISRNTAKKYLTTAADDNRLTRPLA